MGKARDMLKDTKKNLGCLRRSQEIFGQKSRKFLNRRTRGVKLHQSWSSGYPQQKSLIRVRKQRSVCIENSERAQGEGMSIQQRSLHVA